MKGIVEYINESFFSDIKKKNERAYYAMLKAFPDVKDVDPDMLNTLKDEIEKTLKDGLDTGHFTTNDYSIGLAQRAAANKKYTDKTEDDYLNMLADMFDNKKIKLRGSYHPFMEE